MVIRGFVDTHNHQFANLGFGGLAFHGAAYGPMEDALPWCDYVDGDPTRIIHGPGGLRDVVGFVMALSYGHGGVGIGHKVGGYPEHDGWPRWDSVTHQCVYVDWLFRAVLGGLRLMVVHAVNSELMGALVETVLPRDDMNAVDRQLDAAWALEARIDADSGGPGEGWYRIVLSPEQARRVMEDGKLAVVLGIEVDNLFDCREEGDLDEDTLREKLDHYYERGVRHLFPIHFRDNGFGGTAFQNDLQQRVGSPPPDFPRVGNAPVDQAVKATLEAAWAILGAIRYPVDAEDGTAHGYERQGGWQNIRGLTVSGKVLIREMIARGMVIDVDHMSRRSRSDTLDICEEFGYPVVSGHTGFVELCRGEKRHEGNLTAPELKRIRDLGGMVNIIIHQGDENEVDTFSAPGQTRIEHTCGNSSNTLVQAYQYAVANMPGRGVGFGTDLNGFAGLLGPRFGVDAVSKNEQNPLLGLGGSFVAIATSEELDCINRVGNRDFNFDVDGLAHIGMLPDLIADWQAQGLTDEDLEPLLRSAETYLEVWEHAGGRRAGHLSAVISPLASTHIVATATTTASAPVESAMAVLPADNSSTFTAGTGPGASAGQVGYIAATFPATITS